MDRIEAWQRRGFETEALERELRGDPTRASDRLLRQERLIEAGEALRERVDALPNHWQEARASLTAALRRPERIPDVEDELDRLERQRRPWALIARRARHDWSVAGERDRLQSILARFDRMPETDLLELRSLADLLTDPDRAPEIEDGLTRLEARRKERMNLLEGITQMLEDEGFDTSQLTSGDMEDRFRVAAHLQSWERVFRQLQTSIKGHIHRHDPALAESLEAQRIQLVALEPGPEHERFREQVESHQRELSVRLVRLQQQLDDWRMQGYRFPGPALLEPEDLLAWELRSAELARVIERHEQAWTRLERLREHWSEEIDEVDRLRGDTTATDLLEQLAQDLQDRLLSYEQQALELIRDWQQHGLPVVRWLRLVRTSPRVAAERLREEQASMQHAVELIDRLEALDTSLDPDGDTQTWIDRVRSAPTHEEQLERVERWLQRKERRNARLRTELEEEWDELGAPEGWPENLELVHHNLSQLERIVAAASGGEVVTPAFLDDLGIAKEANESEIPEHLREMVEEARREISSWEADGWDTVATTRQLEADPDAFIRRLPGIRSMMDQHEGLRRRLRGLGWERNPKLGDEVAALLRRPEELEELARQLPRLATRLGHGTVIDAGYVFLDWWPGSLDEDEEDDAAEEDEALPPWPGSDGQEAEPEEAPDLGPRGGLGVSLPSGMLTPAGPSGEEAPDEDTPTAPAVVPTAFELARLPALGQTPLGGAAAASRPAPVDEPAAAVPVEAPPLPTVTPVPPPDLESAEPSPPEAVSDDAPAPSDEPRTPPVDVDADEDDPEAAVSADSDEDEAEAEDAAPAPEPTVVAVVTPPAPEPVEVETVAAPPPEDSDVQVAVTGLPVFDAAGEPIAELEDEPEEEPIDEEDLVIGSAPPEPEDAERASWTELTVPLTRLVERLGLEAPDETWSQALGDEASPSALAPVRRSLAAQVGLTPRDARVDRLLRLTLRALPADPASGVARHRAKGLLEALDTAARLLDDWTHARLLARERPTNGRLLQRAAALGEVLGGIPGPGIPLPLGADEVDLPAGHDIDGLTAAIAALHRVIDLPLAGSSVRAMASEDITPELMHSVPGHAA